MKKDLSIIIPFVGEYPQVLFTIQSIAQSLLGSSIDFEIVAVNNYCLKVQDQARIAAEKQMKVLWQKIFNDNEEFCVEDIYSIRKNTMPTFEDKSGPAIAACVKGNEWLKYIHYDERLSHWQAKRAGVDASSGQVLMFVDAHTTPSHNAIEGMYNAYTTNYSKLGSIHLPLTYKILEWHKLIYKPLVEEKYFYSYKFTGFRESPDPYEVACMSTCGMMIDRDIYDAIGGWPVGLGVYGGGENFMNYTLAVCGYKKYIYPDGILFHHGEKRDYHYYYDDFVTNRLIAHYLFGGKDLLHKLKTVMKGRPETLEMFCHEVEKQHSDQRQKIKAIQKENVEDWIKAWYKQDEGEENGL